MLTLALFILAGATTFVPEDIPDFSIHIESSRDSDEDLSGVSRGDFDGDGTVDLLTSKGVFFFRNGHYTPPSPLTPPSQDKPAVVHPWGRDLYSRYADRLEILTWENGAWQKKLTQSIDWPKPDPSFLKEASDEPKEEEEPRSEVRFADFLHDIDGDGTPEIALALRDGIHFFARRGDAYEPNGVLNVIPPPHPLRYRGWSPFNGGNGPMRMVFGQVILSGATLVVIDAERMPVWRVRSHVTRYTLKTGDKGVTAEKVSESVTEPMAETLSPVHLNKDDTVDFAGVDFEEKQKSSLPIPVLIIAASTDGGKTFQTQRTAVVPDSALAFLDVDGDGDSDMIVHRSGLFDGGMREMVTRAFVNDTVKHRVDIYLQDAQGRFSTKPDRTWRGEIRLDAPPERGTDMSYEYSHTGLVAFGDFNKDGLVDLAVQDRPERIAVFLATAEGFQSSPEATVATIPSARFAVTDMNSDGRSDIVVKGLPNLTSTRIYFSREVQP